MSDTAEIRYKCHCMSAEAIVRVPWRREDQDVVEWVERTCGEAIAADHQKRSPLCLRKTMEYAKLPAPENAPYLGGKPVTH